MPRSGVRSAPSNRQADRSAKRPRPSTSSSQSEPSLRRSARKVKVDPMAYNARYHAMDEATRPARARAMRHKAGDFSQRKDSEESESGEESEDETTAGDRPRHSKCRPQSTRDWFISETSSAGDHTDSVAMDDRARGLPFITSNKTVSKQLTVPQHRLLYQRAWEDAATEERLNERVERGREAYKKAWVDCQDAVQEGISLSPQSPRSQDTSGLFHEPRSSALFATYSSDEEGIPNPSCPSHAGGTDDEVQKHNAPLNYAPISNVSSRTNPDQNIKPKSFSQQPARCAWSTEFNEKSICSNRIRATSKQASDPRKTLSQGFHPPLPAKQYTSLHRASRYDEFSGRTSNELFSTVGTGLSVSRNPAARGSDFDSDKENRLDLGRDVTFSPRR